MAHELAISGEGLQSDVDVLVERLLSEFQGATLPDGTDGGLTASDARLVAALASAAALTLHHARQAAETARRQAWSAASAEIFAALLTGESEGALQLLASRVQAIAVADFVCVLRTMDDPMQSRVVAAIGFDGVLSGGDRFPIAGSAAGAAIEAGQPRIVDQIDLRADLAGTVEPLGPTMVVPLVSGEHTIGVLLAGRRAGGAMFPTPELEMVADFAGHASVAMQLADARVDRQRTILLDERARISRDLHDHVIQRLFATGLELRSIAAPLPPGSTADRLGRAIDNVDAAITQIRTAIQAIPSAHLQSTYATRRRIFDIVAELSPEFAHTPEITFSVPVDLVVTDDLADDVIAVVRESLSNVARHASATNAAISLALDQGLATVQVTDDGVGIPERVEASGLANMRERAVNRGGSFAFSSDDGTTRIVWSVPYGGGSGAVA